MASKSSNDSVQSFMQTAGSAIGGTLDAVKEVVSAPIEACRPDSSSSQSTTRDQAVAALERIAKSDR